MKNVGKVDQIVRIILGIALLLMFFLADNNLRYLGVIGIIPLYTGLKGNCVLYSLLGINTRKEK